MKYINAKDILPKQLLDEIREYADGVYLYIPKSDTNKISWGMNTNYHREMELRNQHIYDKYLEGADIINCKVLSSFR